ncbi:MAG: amidohydrolase family protein [Bacteroidetes bacterium]|nr:amidohydrolase family protein [Bacteroidota bacterium]MCW5894693.1 amidohydrolase family protein [Bacteroidota bacterium]
MKNGIRHWSLVIGVLVVSSGSLLALGQIPGKKQEKTIAIVNATIHTVSGPVIEKGTIIFEDGKITAIETQLTTPRGAEVIDATGKHVYPGLMSPDTYIGLTEIGAVRATRDHNETGRINPNVRAEVAVNPESEIIPVTRANGITTFVTAPQGGLISGMSAVMMSDGWTWEDMTLKAPAALVVQWPAMTIGRGRRQIRSEADQIKEREKQLKELADAFRDARAYMNAKKAEEQKGIPYHNVDLRWEAMIPVLEGKVPVMVVANDVQQIQAAVAWAIQENLKLIIRGGHEAWRVTDLLKKHNIPVLAGGIHRLPTRRFDKYDEPFALPKKLHEAGIRFAIISEEEAPHERNLPYQAAHAAAYGLPKEEALKAITLYPAQIFGVADRIGSLELGKDATLIITDGDPLEIMTRVEMQFIEGKKVDLTSRHTMLYEKYKEKYRRMRSN